MLNIPILAIFRGINMKDVKPLVECCINSGIDTVEITMNTENASELIHAFIELSNKRLTVGAGTVLNTEQLDEALQAEARFVVTPIVNIDVIRNCTQNKIPVFPGALTPTEVFQAWNAGATMVKVFPASAFGPSYLKSLKGPLDQVKLMAVGGVNSNTITDFFKNGASAVAVGGSIFSKERIIQKKFIQIEQDLKNLVSKVIS